MGRFIPNLSTIAEPMLRLMRKDQKFKWLSEQQAFEAIKELMSNCETLAFYDPTCATTVIADAGPYGLGAVTNPKTARGR